MTIKNFWGLFLVVCSLAVCLLGLSTPAMAAATKNLSCSTADQTVSVPWSAAGDSFQSTVKYRYSEDCSKITILQDTLVGQNLPTNVWYCEDSYDGSDFYPSSNVWSRPPVTSTMPLEIFPNSQQRAGYLYETWISTAPTFVYACSNIGYMQHDEYHNDIALGLAM
jgi:hypothetical protein